MSLIKFKNVSHTYMIDTPLEYRALKGIDLEIKKGDYHAFIGHTGSGKSTLVQHINGLLTATSGEVIIDGYSIRKTKKAQKELLSIRKKAALVVQFPELQLFAETVERDIMFGPMNFGMKKEEARALAKELIKKVGLPEEYALRSPFELSGGEKRRVAIAGILALEPEVLIVDEPTAGLDPKGKAVIMGLLKDLHNLGLTIIIVTHNMNDVWRNANTATVLEKGEIAFTGDVISLFQKEELLENLSINLPPIVEVIKSLNNKGYKIPIGIKTIETLVEEIKKSKAGK